MFKLKLKKIISIAVIILVILNITSELFLGFNGITIKAIEDVIENTDENTDENTEIDTIAPIIEGVIEGSDYNRDITISFNEGNGLLNGETFISGTTIEEEGIYKLVVEDDAGNISSVNFNIDKSPPTVYGVEKGKIYKEMLTITFDKEDTVVASLNGENFEYGSIVNEDGEYILDLIDWAGNKNSINFIIDKNYDVAVNENDFNEKIYKAIEDKENSNEVEKVNTTVEMDFKNESENNIDVILPGLQIQKIGQNDLNLSIETNDTKVIIDKDVIKNDIGSDNIKELIFTKSSITDENAEMLSTKMKSENLQSTQIGKIKDFNLKVKDENDNTKKIEKFSKKVKIEIQLTKEEQESITNNDKTAVYNIKKDGTYEYMGGVIKDGKIEFETEHFSFYVVMENNNTFSDISGSWAKNEIEILASRNIIKGIDDKKSVFNLKGNIERAQVAVMLSKIMGYSPQKYSAVFKDVDEDNIYAGYIFSAYNKGLLKGDNQNFNPSDGITREQMATMIINAFKTEEREYKNESSVSTSIYADASKIQAYAVESVLQANSLQIMKGYPDNSFYPQNFITREEAAMIFVKFMRSYNLLG